MVDGATEVTDHETTEGNRRVIKSFVESILIQGNLNQLGDYINQKHYTEHSPDISDDLTELKNILSGSSSNRFISSDYKKCHRLLAEGNYVLSVCEGYAKQVHSSFFDLYRLKDGEIVEHWDTTEVILPQSAWKNSNGKF